MVEQKINSGYSCSLRSMQACAADKTNTYIRIKSRMFESHFCPKQTYRKLLFVMLFSLLNGLMTSCRTMRTAMHMQPNQATMDGGHLPPSNHPPDHNTPSMPRFGVVLLHGFMNVATEVDPIAATLRDAFGPDLLLMQPNCREQTKSLTRCLEGQAEDVLKTIEHVLTEANQSVGSFPLFIVGYSHGGVVGCMLAKKHGNKLNIKGMVTINSPLEGAPVLQRTPADVQQFIRDAEHGWTILTQILPDQYEEQFQYTTRSGSPYQPKTLRSIEKEMLKTTKWLRRGIRLTQVLPHWITNRCLGGGKSLLPDDASLQEVRRFLREDPHTIPCMLLGSYQDDFGALFDVDPAHTESMQQLTKAYAKFVTGSEDEKHDTLLPLKSQLCRGPSFESLPTADPNDRSWMNHTLPGRTHVQAQVYAGITHAGNLVPLDEGLFVTSPAVQKLPDAPSMLERLVAFVQEHMDPELKMKPMQHMGTPYTAGMPATKATNDP